MRLNNVVVVLVPLLIIAAMFAAVLHVAIMKANEQERYEECYIETYQTTPESYRHVDYIHTYCRIRAREDG
jgi:hypothetical protein